MVSSYKFPMRKMNAPLPSLLPPEVHFPKMMSRKAKKSCSLGTEVAGIAKCLNAMSFRVGNFTLPVCSHQVPVSPTNLHIAQMHRHKVNGDNYTVLFHQFSF